MRHLKFQQNFPGGPEAMGGGGIGPPHLIRSYRLQGSHHAPGIALGLSMLEVGKR